MENKPTDRAGVIWPLEAGPVSCGSENPLKIENFFNLRMA